MFYFALLYVIIILQILIPIRDKAYDLILLTITGYFAFFIVIGNSVIISILLTIVFAITTPYPRTPLMSYLSRSFGNTPRNALMLYMFPF